MIFLSGNIAARCGSAVGDEVSDDVTEFEMDGRGCREGVNQRKRK